MKNIESLSINWLVEECRNGLFFYELLKMNASSQWSKWRIQENEIKYFTKWMKEQMNQTDNEKKKKRKKKKNKNGIANNESWMMYDEGWMMNDS